MTSQDWAQWSNAFIYAAMFVQVLAMGAFALSFARRRVATVDLRVEQKSAVLAGGDGASVPVTPTAKSAAELEDAAKSLRWGNIGLSLSWLSFLFLNAGVIARAIWAGRAPWGNMYEFSLTSALAVLGVFLLVSTVRDVRWLGVFVIPAVLLTLGLAVTVLYTEAAQLVPALQSYWLIVHVSVAIICGAAFTVAAAVLTLYLVAKPTEKTGAWGNTRRWIAARVPAAQKLDRLAFRIIAFSFPLWTFAVVAGAIWAESAWGRYWGWDPKETWAFITWVVFAGYLHARSTGGWKGTRAAWLGIIGWACYVFNYFGVNILFPGLHSYAGV